MPEHSKGKKRSLPHELAASPWIIIAAAALLAVLVVVLAIRNIHREKEYMSRILSEKGAALIKSFEAGARTGMMGMMGSQVRLQTLLEETARQEDILFIAVTDERGVVLAHNEGHLIGRRFSSDNPLGELEPGQDVRAKIVTMPSEQKAFVVYRLFEPFGRQRFRHMPMHRGSPMHGPRPENRGFAGEGSSPEGERFIFVGLDVAPFAEAIQVDVRNTVVLAAVLLLLGLTGVLVLFWAQRVRLTRSLLQHQQALSDVVISNLPVGLLVLDGNGQIAFINEPARSLLGIGSAAAEGLDTGRVLPRSLDSLLRGRKREETILEREVTISPEGGGDMPVSLSVASILTEDAFYAGEVIILRDLRQVKDLENKVKRQEKLAAIGNLAAGVAHEIRNPLSSIKGFATHFKGRFAEDSPDWEAADILTQEVDRLNRVVTELLEFARPSDIQTRTVNLRQLIDRSLTFVKEDAEQQDVTVEISSDLDSEAIEADPDRLNQALLNLYVNAIQAMDSGGRLRIDLIPDSGWVRIDVSDTGPGIPAELQNTIFDPYYTSKSSGTGLGLAIVLKIVEAHQGRVMLSSRPGGGTTFSVLLPQKQPPEKERGS